MSFAVALCWAEGHSVAWCGGLTLAGCQVPTKAALSITPLLNWTGERKYNERLVGRDKDREITQQVPSQTKQTRLGEIDLIYYQAKVRVGK